jgi:hypothetical protein
MSIETPQFDFGPEKSYNPEMVAEQVVWPLVDYLWRGDWRVASQVGDELHIPKHGKHGDKILDVALEADCDEWTDDKGQKRINYGASLSIEEVTTNLSRDIALQAAKIAMTEFVDENDEDNEEDESELWPEGDEKDFIVRKGASYFFESDGYWNLELYRSIEGPQQRVTVGMLDTELEGVSLDKLLYHDIEAIEACCIVMNAPVAIKKALEVIKAKPVFSV